MRQTNPNPKNEMDYEITIAFSKNDEMTWSCDGKTKEQTEALAETIRAKYPEAQVTIEEKTNIFA
jgi:hypothetical protein